jgi:hypothetical protein
VTAEPVRLGWALLFIGGVLAVFFLTTPERPSRHTASEPPTQVCALEQAPSVGPGPCAEMAQSDPSRQHTGETAWLTQC